MVTNTVNMMFIGGLHPGVICNSCSMASSAICEIWTQLTQEALGPMALGLPVSTVSISPYGMREAMYN